MKSRTVEATIPATAEPKPGTHRLPEGSLGFFGN